MNLKESIRNISIFKNSSEQELEFLEQISTIINYPRNATLYYEAESVSSLQFLIEGQIKVYKGDKYDNEIFLSTLLKYFGLVIRDTRYVDVVLNKKKQKL